jgi:hypothetical protein
MSRLPQEVSFLGWQSQPYRGVTPPNICGPNGGILCVYFMSSLRLGSFTIRMAFDAFSKVLQVMTGNITVFHIDLGQIDFFLGRIRMRGVAVETVRHILGLLLVMRYELVRIDQSAVGLEASFFISQFVKRSSVAG